MEERPPLKFPFYARLALSLLSILLILILMREGKSIIIPLFFSLLIAFMLLPVTKGLERRGIPKALAAFLSILLFILFIVSVFYFLIQQLIDFSRDIPLLGAKVEGWAAAVQQWISEHYGVDHSRQLEFFNKGVAGLAGSATVILQSVITAVGGFVIWTIFVFVFTFFILTHRNLLKKFVTSLFIHRHQGRLMEVMDETRLLANRYVLGLLMEMVIVAALNCTAFYLFGIRYALLLGVMAAVLNIIPYLGIYTGAAIGAIITLSNSTPGQALTVVIILIIIHFLDANILLPRIVGGRVKMNPLITIVTVLTGHIVWGIPGMFLFIPLVAILKIIFERVKGLQPWAILMGTDDSAGELNKEDMIPDKTQEDPTR